MKNKKGASSTDPMVLLTILIIFAVISMGLFKFGTQLATNDNSALNDESIIYIAGHSGFKIDGKTLDQPIFTDEELQDPFYVQVSNSTSSTKDDALEFLYYREQSISWRGLANSVYNFPDYLIGIFGLDLSDWEFVRNAWNLFAWALIFFVIYKIVRGLIK